MKILAHQQPYKEILWSLGLENTSLWGGLLLHDFSLAWFVFVIATLEIVLPNHTWNIIISCKPCFVIIKIKINQTLFSHIVTRALSLRCIIVHILHTFELLIAFRAQSSVDLESFISSTTLICSRYWEPWADDLNSFMSSIDLSYSQQ